MESARGCAMAMNSRRSSELNVLPARRVSTHKTPNRSFCQESGAYIAQVVCIPMRLRAPMSLEAAAAGFQTTAEFCWSTCSAKSMLAEVSPAVELGWNKRAFECLSTQDRTPRTGGGNNFIKGQHPQVY